MKYFSKWIIKIYVITFALMILCIISPTTCTTTTRISQSPIPSSSEKGEKVTTTTPLSTSKFASTSSVETSLSTHRISTNTALTTTLGSPASTIKPKMTSTLTDFLTNTSLTWSTAKLFSTSDSSSAPPTPNVTKVSTEIYSSTIGSSIVTTAEHTTAASSAKSTTSTTDSTTDSNTNVSAMSSSTTPTISTLSITTPTTSSSNITTPTFSSLSITTPTTSLSNITTPTTSSLSITTPTMSPSKITTPTTSSSNITTPTTSSLSITTPTLSSTNITTPTFSSSNITTRTSTSLSTTTHALPSTADNTTDPSSYSTTVSTTVTEGSKSGIKASTTVPGPENATTSTSYSLTVSTSAGTTNTSYASTETKTDSTANNKTVSTITTNQITMGSTSYSTMVPTPGVSTDPRTFEMRSTTYSPLPKTTVPTSVETTNETFSTTVYTTNPVSYNETSSTPVITTHLLNPTTSTTTSTTDSTPYNKPTSIITATFAPTVLTSDNKPVSATDTSFSPTVYTTEIDTTKTVHTTTMTTPVIYASSATASSVRTSTAKLVTNASSTTAFLATNSTSTEIDCGFDHTISHGFINYTDTTYGSSANVTCNTGYKASMTDIQCTAAGVWENATCTIKDCGRVPTISHGFINSTDTTYGSSADVTCNTGYITPKPHIQCTAAGVWENTTCVIKDCGFDHTISHGFINYTDTTYGSSANVTCNTGYKASMTDIQCTAAGVWENATCTIKDCGRVPTISHGFINSTDTTYGSSANVTCNTGYITPKPHIQCTAAGVWENTTCVIKDCGFDHTISHGFINYTDTTYGSSANVTCNTGYKASMTDIQCTAAGVWENATCTIKDCGRVPTFSNGVIRYSTNTTYGSLANVRCNIGYNTSKPIIDCTAAGTWAYSACTIIDCGPVPTIFLGVTNSTNTTYGSSAGVTCDIGYNASKPVIQCTSAGIWENSTCSIIGCGRVPTISYGFINSTKTTYGLLANVTCNTGYNTSRPHIQCTEEGVWENTTCTIIDCGGVAVISNGVINSATRTYGSLANVTCNIGYNTSDPVIQCTSAGTWENSTCTILDCGKITENSPKNGTLVTPTTTTYGSRFVYSCNEGYRNVGDSFKECLANGSWSSTAPNCSIKDCGPLVGTIINGQVNKLTNTTTYGTVVKFTCNEDYTLTGVSSIQCTQLGLWSGQIPTCHKDVPRTCKTEIDSRGTVWTESPINAKALVRCADGFEGNITRCCSDDGIWQLPQYSCIRTSIQAVDKTVANLTENATTETVNNAITAITTETKRSQNSTADQKLTDGEITLLSTALEKVAHVLSTSAMSTSAVKSESITNSFIESASNLIDSTNKDSWKALSSTNSGAEKVLSAVSSMGEVLAKSLKDGGNGTTITKNNIAIEVKAIAGDKVVFPDPNTHASDNDTQWIARSRSNIQLSSASLKGSNVTFITTAVMYRDMSEILPSTRSSINGSDEAPEEKEKINGPILALSITPKYNETLNPPVTITFKHQLTNYTSPMCSFWSFKNGSQGWSSDGCQVSSTNDSFTVCMCNHLTNFAILMSPFREADTSSKALRTVSIVGISVSIVCLIAVFVLHFALWKYLRSDRTTVLMNLCVALLLSYIIFLAGVDRTESKAACTVIAAILHYIYLVVFCVMLVEGILIASIVHFVFNTKFRVKILLVIAWVLPAVIVGISLGASKTLGYGNNSVCWLSTDKGLIWAFVGPALIIITFNVLCILIVIRAIFSTKVMETKKVSEKVKTSLRSLAVLVPLMGISWVVGIFYVDESLDFIQYIFAILNGLQGFFIFLFHCPLNNQVKKGIRLWRRRTSWTWLRTTSGTTSSKYKDSNELKETDRSYVESADYNSRSNNDWREKALEYTLPTLPSTSWFNRSKNSASRLSGHTYNDISDDWTSPRSFSSQI